MAALNAASASSLLPPPDPSLYNAEDDDAEDAEAHQLQQAVTQWIQARKDGAQKKGSQILTELQAGVDASIKKMEGQIQKESKDVQASYKKELAKVDTQLHSKYTEIQGLVSKFNTDLNKAWGEYNGLYEKLDEIKADAHVSSEKRRAALKRKISQTQGEVGALMAEAEKKLVKCKANTQKMPGVLKMLQQIM